MYMYNNYCIYSSSSSVPLSLATKSESSVEERGDTTLERGGGRGGGGRDRDREREREREREGERERLTIF